jgi:hypothetical protein
VIVDEEHPRLRAHWLALREALTQPVIAAS